MNKLVESPSDDDSRSLYTSFVRKHYLIAELDSFILKKQSKYFPATTNIPDVINNALPKQVPPPSSTTHDPPGTS